jgi:quinolinate synthase
MKRITLPNIHACLRDMRNEIHVPEDVIVRARKALDRMLAVGRGEKV